MVQSRQGNPLNGAQINHKGAQVRPVRRPRLRPCRRARPRIARRSMGKRRRCETRVTSGLFSGLRPVHNSRTGLGRRSDNPSRSLGNGEPRPARLARVGMNASEAVREAARLDRPPRALGFRLIDREGREIFGRDRG